MTNTLMSSLKIHSAGSTTVSSGTSQTVALPTTLAGNPPRVVRVVSDTAVYVQCVNGNGASATATLAAESATLPAAGTGMVAGTTELTLTGGTGTAAVFDVTNTEVVSETVTAGGSGYVVADTLTHNDGGTGTDATYDIDSVATVAAQDETDFDGVSTNGTFVGGDGAGGTAYAVSDTITMSDGTVITVDAIDGNDDVTEFTVTSASTSGSGTDDAALTQSSTSGTGDSFTLTLDSANQSVFAASVLTGGDYTVNPTITTATTSSGGAGTGATLTVVMGAKTVAIQSAPEGSYTVIPSNPVSTTGGGNDATLTVVWELGNFTIVNGGAGYETAPGVTVTGGGGSGADITSTLTADVVTGFTYTNRGTAFTSIPTITFEETGTATTADIMVTDTPLLLNVMGVHSLAIVEATTAGKLNIQAVEV